MKYEIGERELHTIHTIARTLDMQAIAAMDIDKDERRGEALGSAANSLLAVVRNARRVVPCLE